MQAKERKNLDVDDGKWAEMTDRLAAGAAAVAIRGRRCATGKLKNRTV